MNRKQLSKFSKATALTLTGTFLFSQSGITILASDASEKEEVIYCMLDNEGSVTGLYAVNSFAGGDIVDYGTYTNIRNLTTTDEILVDGDRIIVHTDAAKLYYQGDLETKDIPWTFDISYKLDGQKYEPEELAGKSGKLELTISITENPACDPSFFDGYALQATVTLDTKLCDNISAEDATIANVGSTKQLSYIILPGKEKDINISADVKDFEMDEITINGMKLDLSMDIDDSKITDKVSELQDAVTSLKDGASDLKDGAGDLKDGANNLKDGAIKLWDGTNDLEDGAVKLNDGAKSVYDGSTALNSGAASLQKGVTSLNTGIKNIQTALTALNGQSESLNAGSMEVLNALKLIQSSLSNVSTNAEDISKLVTASTQISSGMDSLVVGLQTLDGNIGTYYDTLAAAGITDVNDYIAKHNQTISALNITNTQRTLYQAYTTSGTEGVIQKLAELAESSDSEALTLYQQFAAAGNDTAVITNYLSAAGSLISIETLLQADVSYIAGSNTLISGIDSTLDTTNGQLMTGALSLQSNYKEFDKNIQSLETTLSTLATNMASLKAGINTLVENYSTLDSGIQSYTGTVRQISEGCNELYKGALSLTSGTDELAKGTKSLMDGTLVLYNGSDTLKDGTTELKKGAKELTDGTKELANGSKLLADGTNELKDGTEEFYSETENMDTEISDTIDDTVNELTGKSVETISFISDKNTNTSSVLFVMKTPAIEIPETEEPKIETKESSTIIDKIINLFHRN